LDPGRKEEAQARVKLPGLGLVDIGQEYMLEYVEMLNAARPRPRRRVHEP
jgi:hypothetical protein